MYWGGGLERAGGIGRMAGNLLGARRLAGRAEPMLCLDTRGTHSIALAPAYLLAALLRTAFMRLTGRAAMAHVHMADAGSTVRKVIVCRALALLGIPYLLHLHPGNYDTYFGGLPRWGQRLVRDAFARASRVVVLGECWRRLAVEQIGVPPGRVRIVRNGVPDPGFRELEPPSSEPLILFLGELRSWKGPGELIEALASLRDRPWKLVCAGRGDPSPYERVAAAAGVADRMRFAGWVGRAGSTALLREAALVALPSHIEGLSMTLIEALAGGVAVVATPVGAHPDFLTNGESALLVPPGDVPALAAAIASMLDDPPRRLAIARAGRAVFEDSLDIRLIEAQFAELYQEILAETRRRPSWRARLSAISERESIG